MKFEWPWMKLGGWGQGGNSERYGRLWEGGEREKMDEVGRLYKKGREREKKI